MNLTPPTILALAEHPDFWLDIRFQLVGMAIVFVVLTTLWICLEISGYFFRRHGIRTAQIPKEEPGISADVNREVIAVIAAAVHSMVGRSHRIVSIRSADDSNRHQAWSREGRRQIYDSHRIR